jgi:hypothetical protein
MFLCPEGISTENLPLALDDVGGKLGQLQQRVLIDFFLVDEMVELGGEHALGVVDAVGNDESASPAKM